MDHVTVKLEQDLAPMDEGNGEKQTPPSLALQPLDLRHSHAYVGDPTRQTDPTAGTGAGGHDATRPVPSHGHHPLPIKSTAPSSLLHPSIEHQAGTHTRTEIELAHESSCSGDRLIERSFTDDDDDERNGPQHVGAGQAESGGGGHGAEAGVRHLPCGRRRLLEGRGGAGQGPSPCPRRLPAGGGRAPRRARGAPPQAPRPGLRRPRDRAGVPAREPDAVRHGLLRHQLLQAPDLGVRGVRAHGVPGRGHPGVLEHRSPVRPRQGQVPRRDGLLLREGVEPHAAVQDRLLPAVPGAGGVAGAGAGPPAAALLQRRYVRARAQPAHRERPPGRAGGDAAHAVRGAGLPQPLLPRRVLAHPASVQPCARHAVAAPREGGARRGEGGALLRRGVQAVEVHGEGAQHGARGHQGAGGQVVGHLRRREPRLQGCAGCGRRRRRRGGGGGPGEAAAAPGPGPGRRRQVLPRAVGCLGAAGCRPGRRRAPRLAVPTAGGYDGRRSSTTALKEALN